MELFSILNFGFVQRALLAGLFIAVACSLLGVFLVLRRLSLIGDGLAHVTFGSIAIGLFLGFTPLYVAIPLVMLSSLGILKLIDRTHIHGDTAIGIVSAIGVAGGVMLVSLSRGFNADLFSYLFGNILAITRQEVVVSILLSAGVVGAVYFFYQDLVAITFDEESAAVSGIKTQLINRILVMLTALTVVLAMRVAGIMLVSSLLILPAATALQLARGFKLTMALSALAAIAAVLAGVVLSFLFNLPTGATIVILLFIFFIISFIVKKL
jgi:zinc transport system permease protein